MNRKTLRSLYTIIYESLADDGWLQLTADQHAKEVRSNAAAKTRRPR